MLLPVQAISNRAQSSGLKRDWDEDMLAYNKQYWAYTVEEFVNAESFVDVQGSAVRVCEGTVFTSVGTLSSMDPPCALRDYTDMWAEIAEEDDEETAEKGDREKALTKRESAVAEDVLEKYAGLRHLLGVSEPSTSASSAHGPVSTSASSVLDLRADGEKVDDEEDY
eukprot:3775040-Amphidinium_carterae.1